MTSRRLVGLLAAALPLSLGVALNAGTDASEAVEALRVELDDVRTRNAELTARLDARDHAWLDASRTEEIRGIVQDVLADSHHRTSLQDSGAMAGYTSGKGFMLASQDGGFTMRISGQLQTRWVMSHVGDESTADSNQTDWGFQVRRAKVKFKGNVVDKTWRYTINGAFGSSGTFAFEEAMITHDVNDNLSVSIGQYKAPWTREELVSSSRQLAVERSLVNEYFNADRGVGLDVKYVTDDWSLQGAYNNGVKTAYTGSIGRNTSSANNPTKWAVQGRFQYKLSGDWGDFKSFTSSLDDDEAVMIGFAGMAQSWNGQLDGAASDAASVWGVTADLSAKFSGISLFGAVIYQSFDAGDDAENAKPWGVVAQAGYSLTDQWEVFGRFSWANNKGVVDANAFGANPTQGEAKLTVLTVGANYFFNSKVKFTVDWGINLNDSIDGDWVSQTSNGWRETQSADEWVLRAQLQLLF